MDCRWRILRLLAEALPKRKNTGPFQGMNTPENQVGQRVKGKKRPRSVQSVA